MDFCTDTYLKNIFKLGRSLIFIFLGGVRLLKDSKQLTDWICWSKHGTAVSACSALAEKKRKIPIPQCLNVQNVLGE